MCNDRPKDNHCFLRSQARKAADTVGSLALEHLMCISLLMEEMLHQLMWIHIDYIVKRLPTVVPYIQTGFRLTIFGGFGTSLCSRKKYTMNILLNYNFGEWCWLLVSLHPSSFRNPLISRANTQGSGCLSTAGSCRATSIGLRALCIREEPVHMLWVGAGAGYLLSMHFYLHINWHICV